MIPALSHALGLLMYGMRMLRGMLYIRNEMPGEAYSPHYITIWYHNM